MKLFRRRNEPSALPAREPNFTGNIDRFDNGRVQGWAANLDNHVEQLIIQIKYCGRVMQTVVACVNRRDVNDAGISGDHGFDFLLSEDIEACLYPNDFGIHAKSDRSPISIKLSGVDAADICSFLRHENSSGEIVPCDSVWGSEAERLRPKMAIYHNVIYMPLIPHTFLDADKTWGIYSEDGNLVEEAAYRRGESLELVGQCDCLDFSNLAVEESPFSTMIYGGPIIAHYGHFILSSLARSWALDGCYPSLYHSDPPIHEHCLPFVQQLLEAAGATAQNSLSFERPTRIKTLLVPEPALVEQNSISHHYVSALAPIARRLQSVSSGSQDKIYLSKERLSFGIARLDGEAYVSRKLADAGFNVVFPEQLTLAEQLALFRDARLIVGTAGSAFHTQAFASRSDVDRVILSYDRFVNANFKLLDRVTGGRSHYFSIRNHVVISEESGFQVCYRLKNASYFADELIALCERLI